MTTRHALAYCRQSVSRDRDDHTWQRHRANQIPHVMLGPSRGLVERSVQEHQKRGSVSVGGAPERQAKVLVHGSQGIARDEAVRIDRLLSALRDELPKVADRGPRERIANVVAC